jgi:hypothetical protein
MRSVDEVGVEVASLSTALLQTQDEGVAKSLIAAREALEWALGRANQRPTDFIIEPDFQLHESGRLTPTELEEAYRDLDREGEVDDQDVPIVCLPAPEILANRLAAARELAEWTCQKARVVMAKLEGRTA